MKNINNNNKPTTKIYIDKKILDKHTQQLTESYTHTHKHTHGTYKTHAQHTRRTHNPHKHGGTADTQKLCTNPAHLLLQTVGIEGAPDLVALEGVLPSLGATRAAL